SPPPFHYRRLKPHIHQLKHRPIHHPHSHARQQSPVGYRVKVTPQIRVVHRLIPSLKMTAYLLKRLMGISPRTKPIRTLFKVRLEDRLQDQQTRRLHHPVSYRRDAQRPLAPVRLLNVHAPYRLGFVGLGQKLLVKFLHQSLSPTTGFLDLLDTQSVNAAASTIRSDLLPCRPKHIFPIDPVIQGVKPKLRLPLCLLTKLMSQQRKFPFSLRFRKLQFFRSGTFIQAAFPLSSISMSSLRPLRSTIITRFPATMGLSDSRQRPVASYLFPTTVLPLRVSQVPLPIFP